MITNPVELDPVDPFQRTIYGRICGSSVSFKAPGSKSRERLEAFTKDVVAAGQTMADEMQKVAAGHAMDRRAGVSTDEPANKPRWLLATRNFILALSDAQNRHNVRGETLALAAEILRWNPGSASEE